MRTCNQLNEIKADLYHGLVGGTIFQLKKDGIDEILDILAKNYPSQILFLDVFPEHSLSDIKTILSERERMLILKQLGVKHYYSVSEEEFQKIRLSFFNKFSAENYNLHLLCGISNSGVDLSIASQFICSSFDNNNFHWHKQLGYFYPLTGQ